MTVDCGFPFGSPLSCPFDRCLGSRFPGGASPFSWRVSRVDAAFLVVLLVVRGIRFILFPIPSTFWSPSGSSLVDGEPDEGCRIPKGKESGWVRIDGLLCIWASQVRRSQVLKEPASSGISRTGFGVSLCRHRRRGSDLGDRVLTTLPHNRGTRSVSTE